MEEPLGPEETGGDPCTDELSQLESLTHNLLARLEQLLNPGEGDGFTRCAWRILCAVHRLGEPTVGQVQRWIYPNQSTTSDTIGRLCKREYLEKRRSELDNRIVRVRLSPEGKEALARAGKRSALRSAFQRLTPTEAQLMMRSMQQVAALIAGRAPSKPS